jgi:hypothetical protein
MLLVSKNGGFMATGTLAGLASQFHREVVLTPAERERRQRVIQGTGALKVATLVATAVTGILFAAFPTIFLGILFGVTVYGTYEVHRVINNLRDIYEDVTVEALARISRKTLTDQLTKGAPISSWLIDTFRPNLSGI